MGLKGTFFHLPNVIDCSGFIPAYSWTEQSVVYFGRLIKIKGLFTMIDAVKKIKGIQLKIIGDGPLKPALMEKIEEEKIRNISLVGYKRGRELQNEIKKSMFVLLPSEVYENYPYTILESFALGKPVIGSRIGGIPELCVDGRTGFTFNPGDSRDLAEQINHLASRPDTIKKMGKNARKYVEKMNNPEQYYTRLMSIYTQVKKGLSNKTSWTVPSQ
jgi:glycosyltransferase involved in cell wall biosynthesis